MPLFNCSNGMSISIPNVIAAREFNTLCLPGTLILPATVVGLMGTHASEIFITTIIATGMSTIAAIISVKGLEKMKRFQIKPDDVQ